MAPLNRSPSSSKLPILQHFTHKHPLRLLNLPTEFICNGCNELGFGLRYHCPACDFDLHDICATCPTTTPSPLHPHHPLILVNQPVNDRFCDLCGDLVHGLFYTCRACDFDVHPLCTQLPLHVQLPVHPQHLLKLKPAGPAGCARCFKSCTSWRYRCEVCILDIHVECVLGGGPDHVSQTAAAPGPVMSKAVFPPPQQQVGFGGCAFGIPAGGGGGGYFGMPSPAGMMMNQQGIPGGGGGGYYGMASPGGMMMNQQGPATTVEGKKSSGKTRKKIYAVVGRLAATAVVTSLIGIPFGF